MKYEIIILLKTKTLKKKEEIKKIIKIIIENKGLIKELNKIGNTNLYYLIKNQKQAKIIRIKIKGEKKIIQEIENKIRYKKEIIRYIIEKKVK